MKSRGSGFNSHPRHYTSNELENKGNCMPDKIYDLTPPEWYSERSDHYLDYADSYKIICQVLLDLQYYEKPFYSERDVLPILSLFRQYVELQLKGFMLKSGCSPRSFYDIKHDLEKPLLKIKKLNREFKIISEVEDFIIFINKLDAAGESFRYPESIKGTMFFKDKTKYFAEIGTLSKLHPKINKVIFELETAENVFR